MEITDINQLDLTKTYSYADYLTWEIEDVRLEILDGLIKQLETPWIRHHVILNKFFSQMYQYFEEDKYFEMWRIPFHLYLVNDKNVAPDKIKNVVQPDIFVCKKELRGEYGVTGVPELIVEIYRAETAEKKLIHKFELYQSFGIKELWLIDSEALTGRIYYINENGKYDLIRNFDANDAPNFLLFPDLQIDFKSACAKVVEMFG